MEPYLFTYINFLDEEQVEALKALTHDKSVSYFDYIDKIKKNPLARKVKLSDLKDNMNLKDLKKLPKKIEKDLLSMKRREKYF